MIKEMDGTLLFCQIYSWGTRGTNCRDFFTNTRSGLCCDGVKCEEKGATVCHGRVLLRKVTTDVRRTERTVYEPNENPTKQRQWRPVLLKHFYFELAS